MPVAESKKLRLVLDACHVNNFIKQSKFWYENLTTLSEILSEGDYFTTFDLPSGYHHIETHPEHRKFLGFEWTFEMGLQNMFSFVFYHPVCHKYAMFLQRFWKNGYSLSVGEVSALRLLFISMTVLQYR